MSDTTVAPPSAAPPASAPSAPPANEAVINPNPINSQNPVGSQAPEKPTSPSDGRREAIQRAFDRANNPQSKAKIAEKPQAKAAEAKPGHNQPPEQTQPEKLDLKKRPADQPRGERGQFAPRQPQNEQQGEIRRGQFNAQAGVQPARQYTQLPAHAPFREPPTRMADHAKADWAAAPESVRGEIHRMHDEFARAYHGYRSDHEVMNTIRPFHQMATQHGTTLDRALNNYVTMEQKLRSDPIGGLDVIINNLNLRSQDGQKLGLRDIAAYVLNQSPEQHKLLQQSNVQSAAAQQIGGLHQELAQMKQLQRQMIYDLQFRHTRSQIDQIADDGRHPRFDELADLIENEIKIGFDLETAYRRAELLRPTTHAAQTRNPSAQTRPVDRSISGAPSSQNGTARPREPSPTARIAVQNALRKTMNGAL